LRCRVVLSSVSRLGDSKIEQLDRYGPIRFRQEQIAGLDVAMNKSVVVYQRETATRATELVDCVAQGKRRAALQVLIEIFPGEKLHDEIRHALGHTKVVDLHYVGTFQLGCGSGFATEASFSLRVLEDFCPEHLQGKIYPKFHVLYLPDGSHATAGKMPLQAVLSSNDLVRGERHGPRMLGQAIAFG
jgi:hypothetical protein